ncbi:MAG: Cof-type HAD-IIB family hydrolase [Clostridia bacterium]|nr:Cof-type HAD-IIB family hydrolase [Clostridia bacterium]
MKYKMIVADCDDTMLNKERYYSDYFRSVLERYIQSGGKFVIATGRMTAAVLPYCRDLGLKGEVITYQGAITADIETAQILECTQADFADARRLGEYIESLGLYYHIYDENFFYVKEDTNYSKRYAALSRVEYKILGYGLSDFIGQKKLCPLKMMVITDEQKVKPLIEDFKRKFGDKFLFNTSKKWMVEIVPIMANKGVAVKRLAEKYGFGSDEVICIGDSLNDLAMIEYAGLGVVVDNGSAEAKAAADIIAPSNEDDGVAYIISKYGFLE